MPLYTAQYNARMILVLVEVLHETTQASPCSITQALPHCSSSVVAEHPIDLLVIFALDPEHLCQLGSFLVTVPLFSEIWVEIAGVPFSDGIVCHADSVLAKELPCDDCPLALELFAELKENYVELSHFILT